MKKCLGRSCDYYQEKEFEIAMDEFEYVGYCNLHGFAVEKGDRCPEQ